MTEEHRNAEAHLIGSLIDSLSNATEDDVFFASSTPNSSLPLPDSSSEQLLKFDSIPEPDAMQNSFVGQPHQIPLHILQQLQQAQQPFWAPPVSTMPIRERPPFHPQLPPGIINAMQGHGRWIPSPNAYVQPPPGFSPMDLYQQQQYQAFLAFQRQYAVDQSAMQNQYGILRNNDLGQLENQARMSSEMVHHDSDQNPPARLSEQWESVYTPFGPVRGPGNFNAATDLRLAAQEQCVVYNSASVGRQLKNRQQYPSESGTVAEMESKRRSASVTSPLHSMLTDGRSVSNANTVSSASSGPVTTSSASASSPSLPPKGRSYLDVAKSKTESKMAARSRKLLSSLASSGFQDDRSKCDSTQPAEMLKTTTMPSRKLSVPVRESSSDSISEFGGSENGASLIPSAMENYVGFLDKRPGSVDEKIKDVSKLTDQNILKKNATTTTMQSGDFKKIGRRKISQPKLVQGREPSPVVAAESRYAVLSKKSPTKSDLVAPKIKMDDQSWTSPVIDSAGIIFKNRLGQQGIKLNNEEAANRLASKSPTRKAAYIINDLSWPVKTKSTNWRNESGEWADDVDDVEFSTIGRNPEHGRDRLSNEGHDPDQDKIDGSDEGADNQDLDDDDQQRGDSKEEADSGLRHRKKSVGMTQKYGTKKGKSKRGDGGNAVNKRRRQQHGPIMCWLNLIATTIAYYVRDAAFWLMNLITDIGHQLWDITFYFSKSSCIKISTSMQYAWYSLAERLRKLILCIRQKEWSILLWWRSRRKNQGDSEYLGLEENIDLPNTGEEALRRLLSCRGQDAYSILGLRPDCTDDEVKCYYRRQAILVHPDKNPCYGSDEAFKILAAAFELIGTPERRRAYDLQNLHKTKAMQELQDMLAKLKEKMEEIRSTMQCDCGGKHKRFPTERELAYARYCRKCGEKHHAREGDIWAESHWFGFLWYYYACMEGSVYDITEWAGCQKNNLKHMKPDTHMVQYRLITGRNARQFNQQQYSNPQQPHRQASDSAMGTNAPEDLLNQYWEERFSGTSRNLSPMAPSMYLPQGSASASTNFGGLGGVDFNTPAQSKFNPPSCPPHGDSRPRKAGRRRKARM